MLVSISQPQTRTLVCPNCHSASEATVWRLLDSSEQPDVAAQLMEGNPQAAVCPTCQQDIEISDTSCLLYDRTAIPPLLFIPARQTTPEEDYRDLGELTRLLRERLQTTDSIYRASLGQVWPELLQAQPSNAPLFELELPPSWHQDRQLAEASTQVYQSNGDIQALELALARWKAIINHSLFVGVSETFQLIVLNDAAGAFLHRYGVQSNAEDLDTAIRLWKYALQIGPGDVSYLPFILTNLGVSLSTRYERFGLTEDLEQAIQAYRGAALSASEDAPFYASILNNLGAGLRDRYNHTTRLEDLEEAIQVFRTALAYVQLDVPTQVECLNNLALALRDRYSRLGQLEDLEEAIAAFERALPMAERSPNLPRLFHNLGAALRSRYERTGDLSDIERAIQSFRHAGETMSPQAPEFPSYQSSLSLGLRDRYLRQGQRADLEEAVQILEQAVVRIPVGSPFLPVILNNLGLLLRERYAHLGGSKEDVDRIIEVQEEALNRAPADFSYLPSIFVNLGIALRERYTLMGQLEDIERAVWAYQQAVARLPDDAPELPGHLSSLGGGLFVRYSHTGQFADLDHALDAFQRAVSLTPDSSPDLPLYLSNVGIGLRARYRFTQKREDIDQSIRAFQQAVEATEQNAPLLHYFLNGLAACLHDRYELTGQREDLEQAIETFRKAVPPHQVASFHLSEYYNNLGLALRSRFLHTGSVEDLEQATAFLRAALPFIPADSQLFVDHRHNLGLCLRDRYEHSQQPEDKRQAIEAFEEACQKGLQVAPDVVLSSARRWGDWAAERHAWPEAARAYTYGIEAIEQLYRTQLSRTGQEAWLGEASGLHPRAAFALAQSGKVREAVAMLEKGRARRLKEALARDRAELARILREAPAIGEAYQRATDHLAHLEQTERQHQLLILQHQISSALTTRPFSEEPALPAQADQIEQARAELRQALTQIRQLRGHEQFLADWNDQVMASLDSPLAYLVTLPFGSLAVFVQSGWSSPEALLIPSFTTQSLSTLLIRRNRKTRAPTGGYLAGQFSHPDWLKQSLAQMNRQLGQKFIRPLAALLRRRKVTSVALIPIGLLGLLPLHTCEYHVGKSKRCLLDEFTVTYAPSAQVLFSVQKEAQRRHGQVGERLQRFVGVGNPLADDHTGAWVRDELRALLPELQQVAHPTHRSQRSIARLSPAKKALTTLWTQALQQLERVCKEPPKQIKYAGSILQQAGSIYALLKEAFPTPDPNQRLEERLNQLVECMPPSLPYARAELETLFSLVRPDSGSIWYEQQAGRDIVWDALPQAQFAHFACHGFFNAETPLASSLLLAGGTRLTLQDLLTSEPHHLASLRLVVLSACQTAMTDFQRLPDEVVGLVSGFLQAGVPSIIGTLWPVDDVASSFLVIRFYELFFVGDEQAGLPPQPSAQALREAQRWLRDSSHNQLLAYVQEKSKRQQISPTLLITLLPTLRQAIRSGQGDAAPFADSYYWAGFTHSGAL